MEMRMKVQKWRNFWKIIKIWIEDRTTKRRRKGTTREDERNEYHKKRNIAEVMEH